MAERRPKSSSENKSSKAVTLKDVADRAGVHLSTVSRVLNPTQRKMVSDDVAIRVKSIAKEMGYRANPFGYGLRTNKSNTIGVVVPDLTNPVFPPIIRGIDHTLREIGYTAIFADSNESVGTEGRIVEQMQSRQVEGLILASAHRADKIVEAAVEQGLPLVLINRTTGNEEIISVTNDDNRGALLAVDHLIELGHRKIAHIAGPRHFSTGYNRRKGYLEALKRRNIKANKTLIIASDGFGIEDGARGFRKLKRSGEEFTAIFAGNDAVALGCYKEMKESGMSCPEDVSIVGYNDMPLMDLVQPKLTTVRIDLYKMGKIAAHSLAKLIDDTDGKPVPTILEPELIVRHSTAAPSS